MDNLHDLVPEQFAGPPSTNRISRSLKGSYEQVVNLAAQLLSGKRPCSLGSFWLLVRCWLAAEGAISLKT